MKAERLEACRAARESHRERRVLEPVVCVRLEAQPLIECPEQDVGARVDFVRETAESVGFVSRTRADDQAGAVGVTERRSAGLFLSPIRTPWGVESDTCASSWAW